MSEKISKDKIILNSKKNSKEHEPNTLEKSKKINNTQEISIINHEILILGTPNLKQKTEETIYSQQDEKLNSNITSKKSKNKLSKNSKKSNKTIKSFDSKASNRTNKIIPNSNIEKIETLIIAPDAESTTENTNNRLIMISPKLITSKDSKQVIDEPKLVN